MFVFFKIKKSNMLQKIFLTPEVLLSFMFILARAIVLISIWWDSHFNRKKILLYHLRVSALFILDNYIFKNVSGVALFS